MKKLTPEDIRLICALGEERNRNIREAQRLSNREIARKFDVHANTIQRILNDHDIVVHRYE